MAHFRQSDQRKCAKRIISTAGGRRAGVLAASSLEREVKPNIPQAVRHLIEEYRRFLRTSYRFLDPRLRRQFEAHLAEADVVVRGPYVTLARDFERARTLRPLVEAGRIDKEL